MFRNSIFDYVLYKNYMPSVLTLDQICIDVNTTIAKSKVLGKTFSYINKAQIYARQYLNHYISNGMRLELQISKVLFIFLTNLTNQIVHDTSDKLVLQDTFLSTLTVDLYKNYANILIC